MPTYNTPDGSRSLFDLYDDANRGSDVPAAFNQWCLASVIGAVVSPFICAYTTPDQPIYTDMRVFLIGKSGSGKGKAMGRAHSLLDAAVWPKGRMLLIDGSVTAALLVKEVSEWQQRKREEGITDWMYAPLYLMHQELFDDLGTPESARSFISFMTNLGSRHTQNYSKGSIYSGGTRIIRSLSPNWIAGTTIDWLKKVYDPDAVRSGAFARIVPVYVADQEVPAQRAFESHPRHFTELIWSIQQRLADLTAIKGTFAWTGSAREVYTAGVEQDGNGEERDPAMESVYARVRELVVKYAMVHALAQPDAAKLELTEQSIAVAQREVRQTIARAKPLYHVASETKETSGLHQVEAYIKRKGQIRERALLQWAKAVGMDMDKVKRHLAFLAGVGNVVRETAPQPIGTRLVWAGKGKGRPKDEVEEPV